MDGTSLGVLNNARFAVWDPGFDNSGEREDGREDGRSRGLLEHELNVFSDVLADSGCKVLLHAELGVVASLGGVCENMGLRSPGPATSSCTSDPALLLHLLHAQQRLTLERYRLINRRMTATVTQAAHVMKPIIQKI